jgi:hypothetical protein
MGLWDQQILRGEEIPEELYARTAGVIGRLARL